MCTVCVLGVGRGGGGTHFGVWYIRSVPPCGRSRDGFCGYYWVSILRHRPGARA